MVESKEELHMTTNKKGLEGTAIPETSPCEINQVHSIPGFETCQDIQTIMEELERLDDIMKRTGSEDQYSRSAVRYWAIRWVMGWEKEIPQMKGERR